jgi:hypothetical protein
MLRTSIVIAGNLGAIGATAGLLGALYYGDDRNTCDKYLKLGTVSVFITLSSIFLINIVTAISE